MEYFNTFTQEEIKERIEDYDFTLSDGLNLSILLTTYHNLIGEFRVHENYIDVYDMNSNELDFFDGNDFMRIYVPQDGKLNITLFVDEVREGYLRDVINDLTEQLSQAIQYREVTYKTEINEFSNRIKKIASECLPSSIDRTEQGEFMICDVEYGEEAYFLNEDCHLTINVRGDEINAHYYSDADVEYKFDVDINQEMSDDEIRDKLVKGFSEKFGWVDLFTEEETPKGVDVRFWASVYSEDSNGNDTRTLLELNREFFDLNQEVTNLVGTYSDDDEEDEFDIKYTDLCEKVLTFILDKKLPQFSHVNQDDFIVEFLRIDEKDKSDSVFLSISLTKLF